MVKWEKEIETALVITQIDEVRAIFHSIFQGDFQLSDLSRTRSASVQTVTQSNGIRYSDCR